jgi:hypothetical protein
MTIPRNNEKQARRLDSASKESLQREKRERERERFTP